MANNQTGKIVLFLYPTPKCFKLPSLLYKNAGETIWIEPNKNKNKMIENNGKCCRIYGFIFIAI